MKRTKKFIRNFIFFVILMFVTFYIIFKDQNIFDLVGIVRNANLKYIIIAIVCMCIYLSCEAINIGRTLKALNEKSYFLRNLKYALIGFFYSGITPAASGGQPMQIYYMHKNKISVANSTLALLINLASMQIVTISIALISVIFNHQYLTSTLAWLFVLGLTLNASALALLIMAIFSRKSLEKIVNFIIKVMKKLRIKNIEQKKEKFEKEIEKYQASAVYIKNNKKMILKILLTTYIQFLIFDSITYWVYRAFNFSEFNILKIISLQSILYATVSGIPSPGAVGVTEGGFIAIFEKIYTKDCLNAAMLLNRGINFYFMMFISGIVAMVNIFRENKETKEKEIS